MKTVMILFRHFGEVCYTPKSPQREWLGEQDTIDLAEQKDCILSNDDFRPVRVNRWDVQPVEIPDWMEGDDYAANAFRWESLWITPGAKTFPEDWQVYLALYVDDPKERHALAKLLAVKTFRSEFRQSLRNQVVAFIETPPDQRKYDKPLSWKQMSALLRWER